MVGGWVVESGGVWWRSGGCVAVVVGGGRDRGGWVVGVWRPRAWWSAGFVWWCGDRMRGSGGLGLCVEVVWVCVWRWFVCGRERESSRERERSGLMRFRERESKISFFFWPRIGRDVYSVRG